MTEILKNSDIIITTQNSNIDADEFPVIPISNFDLEESEAFLLKYTNKRMKTESDIETVLPAYAVTALSS